MHNTKQDALRGVFDALRLFPFSLAVGVCSGFGILGGCVSALAALVCGAVFGCAFCPSWLTLLPVFAVTFRFGAGAGAAAILLSGVFAFLMSLLPQSARKKFSVPPVACGFLLAEAFTATALHTTDYFGIGAVGGTTLDILADYVSLGFHPNWRGILYGTIVMVVLITYPRKFKTLSKKISAAFASLLITFPLHLLLVPRVEGSPIDEVGIFSYRELFAGAFFPGKIPVQALPMLLCAALSLALLATNDQNTRSIRALSAVSLCTGVLGGVPLHTDGTARRPLSALTAAAVTVLLYLCPALSRMPVHCLAVILIVTAWQSIDWGALKKTLTGGTRSILLFVCSAALTVIAGIHYAVPLLCCLSALQYKYYSD